MKHRIAKIAALGLIMAGATAAYAQQPAAPAAPARAPEYMVVNLEGETINKPAAEVWAKVGKFCDLQAWLNAPCQLAGGQDGQPGAVRSIAGGRVIEILVSATPMSYTYAMPLAANSYHGKLEVRPLSATTSKVYYSIFEDVSMMADQAAKDRRRTQLTNQFTGAVNNMKILAEGGTIPAPAGRGGGGGGAAAPGRGG